MKKLVGLITLFLLSATTAISADMRFVQVDGALYNSADAQRFENLVAKINKEKNVEFVVFTGNNISRPREAELEQFLLAAKKLKHGGRLCMCQRTERLVDLISKMVSVGLNPTRIQMVVTKAGGAPYLFLIEGVKGVKPQLKILPEFVNEGV